LGYWPASNYIPETNRRRYRLKEFIPTILIVEDDVFIRDIAVMMIDDMGHTVLSACDMAEALAILRSPALDALITDLRLDDGASGGLELAPGDRGPAGLRVLYVTGRTLTDELRAEFVPGGLFLSSPTPKTTPAGAQDLFADPDLASLAAGQALSA
jgi:CheY-like chemotaxis protein